MDTRTIVQRHATADTQWESATRPPSANLRGIVLSYQDYSEKTRASVKRLEVPFAGVPVVFSFGQTYRISDPTGMVEDHRTFAAGLADSWVVVESEGDSRGVQVNFTPIGARLFLGLPMSELTNRTVDLDDVLGPVANHLTERLHNAPDWNARFDILDDFIARRIAHAGEPSVPVIWAWNRVRAGGGRANVGTIASEMGYSHRRLIAQFRDHIGLPPKTMARIVRFERAVGILRSDREYTWPDVAFECGYYDQAHFNREFREFSGCTPTEFTNRLLEHGNGVLGD